MLREIIEQKGIRGIAEEMSKDGLPFSRNRRSVGKQLADQLGLAHDYSDPDEATWKTLLLKRANKLTQNVSDIGWNGFNPLLNSQLCSSWVPATLRVLRVC